MAPWLCALALAIGCGGDDDPGEPDVGDQPSNGLVRIDERALRGEIRDGQLELAIPVAAIARETARGELSVSLIEVESGERVGSAAVDYEIEAGASDQLTARLRVPASLASEPEQALLVDFNVRVEQRDDRPLRVTRSLLHVLPIYELKLEGPSKLLAEKKASYRALLQDPRTRAPLEDTRVQLVLSSDGEAVETMNATTDEVGSAVFDLEVDDPGEYDVAARVAQAGTSVELSQGIDVSQPGQKILLTTDKPIYEPGQTIHLRALALENPGNQPIADREIVFEVEDGKGNKILKRARQTNEYGIASTTFALATMVNMGTFKVRALAGDIAGERTVEVSRYVLPKFEIQLSADRTFYAPGQTITGSLHARYFFGKEVAAGDVVIEAATLDVGENVFQRVMGRTAADGTMDFEITLPDTLAGIPLQDGNALVTLRAIVTDSAGQEVRKERAITVASSPVRLALVPESTTLVPGIENRLHVFASDPLGAPIAMAEVEVTPDGADTVRAETDPFGHVELRWTPAESASRVDVVVTADDLPETRESFDFGQQMGQEHVLVRTDKSIYQLGDNVHVEIFTSADESTVYVDLLNEGQAVDMRTLAVEGGRASFDVALDSNLLGDNRVEAYVVDAQGTIVRAGRSFVTKGDGALSVKLETDKASYKPGEPAQLTFSVVDEAGEPAVAALGVQIVDEAVFGLIDARPGLLKTYFELEDSFATPTYEIKGPIASFEQLLFTDTAPNAEPEVAGAAQARAEGALAALVGRAMTGHAQASWPKTVQSAHERLSGVMAGEKKRVLAVIGAIASDELQKLIAQGCKIDEYYCDALGAYLSEELIDRLRDRKVGDDPWGSPYRSGDEGGYRLIWVSRGPDELKGTDDDEPIELTFDDLNIALSEASGGTVDGGLALPDFDNAGGDGDGDGDGDSVAEEGGDGDGNPRVRREFPETLYVNPAIITDENGKATIGLDMADSITEWRVSMLANAKDGKLGGGQSGITVFQDFFTDVSFPAVLTRGDEVEFPIVVYNYLDKAQSVRLELEATSWFTALGSTELMLELAPGEVRAARLPVRVDQVGVQTLTVRAFGTDASDAVARMVRVEPDGQEVPDAQSGSLAEGSTTLNVDFPADAVPGSQQLYLEVYPAFLAQAVSGLDSMLQEPYGCFEQTTSTTWPNVLVAHYLRETNQGTPEIALKAETLISTGYQRLLTFEHQGGGFSWFGEEDPAPFLSVTAFGLMEFADMAAVHEVDPQMIARTQDWLVAQQEADGSFKGDMSEFFSFHTSAVRNTAFVAWALAQNGYSGPALQRALDFIEANFDEEEPDGYTLALIANAFASAAPNDGFGTTLLDTLDGMKTVDGDKASWDTGGTQTNFYSDGDDGAVTTTALIAHAMLIAGGYPSTVNAALAFLTSSKDASGNFGSTQATVWSLKTLLLAALKGTDGAVGTFAVELDGAPFASLDLTPDQAEVMTLVDMSELATTGAHAVELTFQGTGKVSYNLVSKHHVPWVASEPSTGPLSITVAYDRTSLAVDETVKATLTVKNETDSGQNMVLVTAGIPPGFEVLTEDLAAYVDNQQLSRHEKTGKQLILYVSALEANEARVYEYRLRATMPVRAVDGGAEAHLYYEPEKRTHAPAQMLAASAE